MYNMMTTVVWGLVLCNVRILLRDEKEGIKKQARSNKQQGKATQHTCTCV